MHALRSAAQPASSEVGRRFQTALSCRLTESRRSFYVFGQEFHGAVTKP
jgi:hypothetical protein